MAKVISFQVPKSKKEFVRYQEDRGKHFYDKLHQHPQLQLTVILEGKGQFLSGDYVGRFQPGDVFFLGENAPHVFRSDSEYFEEESSLQVAGNTIFFDFEAIQILGELEDLEGLNHFRDFSGGCFQVKGIPQEEIKQEMQRFSMLKGLDRFQSAFRLLAILDRAGEELVSLNRSVLSRGFTERDGSRMNQVMQFLLEKRFEKIALEEVAAVANLSKEAFCRFFKLRTRKTFTQYLLELRINEAQKLLRESDLGIAEIAYQVGFENLSYFNRGFKKIAGITPKEWRKLNS
ncbi:AraC family transcriptional regulator [Algoriphagus kandeliae]|uniref:AraC family transcriptional regulator n=1 Tax=Algoriphagus kandeliae TaxID=2562278 RepID=A0A4Y9QVA0_9BACT|nr:AraC family transcriptional regulator [Algoriphagus kandeliae]TFV96090.1 AraC family transcriptional regulator [Algoriphagus kandeliae]